MSCSVDCMYDCIVLSVKNFEYPDWMERHFTSTVDFLRRVFS